VVEANQFGIASNTDANFVILLASSEVTSSTPFDAVRIGAIPLS
jgi:hypothetical protein